MKVFISYSTKDRATASSLFRDLRDAGATAFQYGSSEAAGEPAWDQIIRWISECDTFIVLVSSNAVGSTAVLEEIAMAHDCYINSERRNPSKIIPAIIEGDVAPPLLIRRMSFLDLMDYDAGLPELLDQLGLRSLTAVFKSTAPALPAIDFDKLALDYKQAHPPSTKEEQSRLKVLSLLTKYEDLKPADLPHETEEQHVDSLVAGVMGKSPFLFADPRTVAEANEAFLGVSEPEPSAVTDRLLSYTSALVLAAPTLRCEDRTLHWTPVFTASAYILERGYSLGTDLLAGSEVYRGPDVSYEVPAGSLSMAYRVKATEGVFSEDSPWSNIVEPLGLHPIPSTSEPGVPAAPSLTIKPRPLAWDISWTEVPDATSYVLERKQSMRGSLFADSWERVYEGTGTGFSDLRAAAGATSGLCTYRVKALGPWGETAWGF